jgi:hypothetical protein
VIGFRLRVAALVGAVLVIAAAAGTAEANTTTSLTRVQYRGDSFFNYDFNTAAVDAINVDWPVDIIFWGRASISKVYRKIGWAWSGSNKYERVNDGTGAVWISSGGRKNTLCTDTHFRLYAPSIGYLKNPVLGHYVIATAHLDKNECGSSPTYGWNETAEANVAARAATVWGTQAVQQDAATMPDGTPTLTLFQNAQTGWQGNHYFNNDGSPTLIKVS